jgi:hypothetical protein
MNKTLCHENNNNILSQQIKLPLKKEEKIIITGPALI